MALMIPKIRGFDAQIQSNWRPYRRILGSSIVLLVFLGFSVVKTLWKRDDKGVQKHTAFLEAISQALVELDTE